MDTVKSNLGVLTDPAEQGLLNRDSERLISEPGGLLVTGSSGFIGRRLVSAISTALGSTHIVALDHLSPEDTSSIALDIRQPLVGADPELQDLQACVHLAALAKEPGYDHASYFETNDGGTRNVLDLCTAVGVKTVIFTSTMMVFAAGERINDEDSQIDPDTAYGSSKALAEHAVLKWAAVSPGRRAVILRPGVVFGPNDSGNFSLLRDSLRSRRFFYIGRTNTVKSCVHIDDLVGFIQHCLADESISGIYHVAFPVPTTISEIVESISAAHSIAFTPRSIPLWMALAMARPLSKTRIGRRRGIHPRRIEKLNRSTHLKAVKWLETGYQMKHPGLESACLSWAEESP
jgi:GlcNAc-P-P-Und epimerase